MKTYWKMRDGKLIDVDEMDINHLRNTLKMLIRASQAQVRNSQIAKKPAPPLKFELKGDMAQLFNDDFPGDDEDLNDHPYEN